MTDLELHDRMRAAVDDVLPAPNLPETVRRAGNKRLVRRRTALSGIAAAVLMTGAAVATGNLAGPDPRPAGEVPPADDPYRPLLNRPTGGDLKHDDRYLGQAVAAWNAGHDDSANHDRGIFDDLRGRPHVVWAGRTPAGRVAIVVQQAYLREHDDISLNQQGIYTLIGFVHDSADSSPRLAADAYPAPSVPVTEGFLAGADQRVLVVADRRSPRFYATGRTYVADGPPEAVYRSLQFSDGAAVVSLPEGTKPAAVRIASSRTPTLDELGWLAGQDRDKGAGQAMWLADDRWRIGAPGTIPFDQADALFESSMGDAARAGASSMQHPPWRVYGSTPDLSVVIVGERALDQDPSHLYAVLERPGGKLQIVHGGVADPSKPLPVAIRLPDRQGWVVAQRDAELGYRSGAGAWTSAGRNAALISDTATEVRVVRAGNERIVQLPR